MSAAHPLELVHAQVGLRDRITGHHNPMILHKEDGFSIKTGRQSFTLSHRAGQAQIVVVVGNPIVKKSRGLARRQESVIDQHIERERPILVGVQDHVGPGNPVNGCVDTLGRQLHNAVALDGLARLVENDHVACARFGPVPPKGQDQESVVLSWHGNREVIVDALIEFVQNRQT